MMTRVQTSGRTAAASGPVDRAPRRRQLALGATAVAALGLGLVGCGSSGASATTASGTVTVTQTESSAGGSSASTGSPGGTSEPGGPAPCATADLRLTLGTADHATSHSYIPLRFQNTGATACSLTGFPGVSYVTGDSGTQVGAAARRDGPAGTTVTLAPGGAAVATIGVTSTGPYDPATCAATTVRGFRVYPPGERHAAFVADTLSVCSNASLQTLTITAVAAA